MKKILTPKYIVAIFVALIIVFTNKAEASTGTVTTETLNLRSEASTSSSVIKLLNINEKVEIISEEGNWYKVDAGDKEGYVSKDYIKLDTDNSTKQEIPTSTNTGVANTANTEKEDEKIATNTTFKLEKDINIKILPLINSSNLGILKSGEEITVIAMTNNWIFVQTNEISGWILKDSAAGKNVTNEDTRVEETNKEVTNTEKQDIENKEDNIEVNKNETDYEQSVTKYINASSVYIRSEPSTTSNIVTTLIKNTDVKVTGEVGDWYKVKFNDYNGYIYKELLSDSKIEETNRSTSNRENMVSSISNNQTSSLGSEIVEYAKQYLGCPYVYGAAGSQSFDCSGFTMYVYKHFGYSLSHSATAQSKVGQYVAKENLQPGDLVFFLDYETMDGIGHCGIYIGDGEFIHASSGSGYCVKTSTLLSGSYYNRYATARRLI